MTEQQYRTIERMGLNADDNTEFLAGFASGDAAVDWFLGEGWPFADSPVTDEDRAALLAYVNA